MKVNAIEGVLLKEDKHRFACLIMINGKIETCYVPSSSKLSKYLNIEGVPVLVTESQSAKCKMKYKLLAVQFNREWIIVNLNILNPLFHEQLVTSNNTIFKEQRITNEYKADFLIILETEKNIIIEVKGIISNESTAIFPMHSGERAKKQLANLSELLVSGKYQVEYVFMVLSSEINQIKICSKDIVFKQNFEKCIKNGMKVSTYRVNLLENSIFAVKKHDITIIV